MPRLNSILLTQFLLLAKMFSVSVSCKIGKFNTLLNCLLQIEQQRELTNCVILCAANISAPTWQRLRKVKGNCDRWQLVFIDLWLSLFMKESHLKTRIKAHNKKGGGGSLRKSQSLDLNTFKGWGTIYEGGPTSPVLRKVSQRSCQYLGFVSTRLI